MNSKQRDELAKYLWDLSKVAFTILVVGQLARKEDFTIIGFIGGIVTTCGFALAALYLRRKKRK